MAFAIFATFLTTLYACYLAEQNRPRQYMRIGKLTTRFPGE